MWQTAQTHFFQILIVTTISALAFYETSCTHNSPATRGALFSVLMSSGARNRVTSKQNSTVSSAEALTKLVHWLTHSWWGKPRSGMVSGTTRGYFHRSSATRAPSTVGARIRLDHSLPACATKFVAIIGCILNLRKM